MGWVRWYDDVLEDKKLAWVARELKLPIIAVRGAWASLLLMANQSPIRGTLMLDATTPYSIADIQWCFHTSKARTKSILEAFSVRQMIEKNADGVLAIRNWDKRQYESDSSTKRVQKHRSNGVTETFQKRSKAVARNVSSAHQSTDTDMYPPLTPPLGGDSASPGGDEKKTNRRNETSNETTPWEFLIMLHNGSMAQLNEYVHQELEYLCSEFGSERVMQALETAARNGKRGSRVLGYARAILYNDRPRVSATTSEDNWR